jgi:antirestriction protein ArdC
MTSTTHAQVSQAREDLERAVAELRASSAWRRHLAVMARFHRYSWHNQLLIGQQLAEATYVRGFKAWLDAGRAVRKGERGIRIFAPRPWQRSATVDEAGTEQIERGVSFTVVHVFDVSQTDPIPGHPHPWEPPIHHPAVGDASLAVALWSAMLEHAAHIGLTVSTSAADPFADRNTYGYFRPAAGHIWVRPNRPFADMAATLAHELAHAITHDVTASMSRGACEVVAESVAYAVCSRFGLDLALRSAEYVAGWLDDPDAFRAGMAAIHHGAASLIDALEVAIDRDSAPSLAA